MIPILFQTITEGTVPTNKGLGHLTDCISAQVTEERNGSYELSIVYSAEGIHAEDIQPNRFIMAKPNFTDNPQIFRIYKVGKSINGKFEVSAQHISYDLSGKIISTGTASSCAQACLLLDAKAGSFTIDTDKTTSASFKIDVPSSVRSWFGGKEGSLLDVYGGEWKFDNYTASLKNARGQDRGVQIRYGKNLTDLSQVLDMSNLCTGIVPYYVDANGNKTVGTKVSTGLPLDVDRDVAIDFSTEVDPESSTAIATQLANLANRYKSTNNLTTVMNNISLDFVQMKDLTERVDLCDTVHIFFEPLGITASAKCIATVWDVLEERYTRTTFGEARTNICDTIASNTAKAESAASRAYVNESSQLITGNLGGYVILHDSDGDGKPDEILIMNTDNPSTATQVWRFNKGGLGHGTSYTGPFNDIALTSDGKINASRIVTGTLNANVIKAGVISDAQGNSTIDMTNGEAILNNLKAKRALILVDANGIERGQIKYTIQTGAALFLREPNNQATVSLTAGTSNDSNISLIRSNGTSGVSIDVTSAGSSASFYNASNKKTVNINGGVTYGGAIDVLDTSNHNVASLIAGDYGGQFAIQNTVQKTVAQMFSTSSNAGYYHVANSNGTQTIYGNGSTGALVCVSLTQTSSRKVKDNIRPIEDADKILDLEAVAFDYKDENQGTDKRGFIAEDVAEVLPNLVTPEKDGRPATLDYISMIPYLQTVIKEQEKRIKALEDKLNGNSKP